MDNITVTGVGEVISGTADTTTWSHYIDSGSWYSLAPQDYSNYRIQGLSYKIREEELEGKRYIVVPVVMMVEGVHHGSQGPILHHATELAKFTAAWDGRPVTISHPKERGENVSANSPRQIAQSVVGKIFNTYYDHGLKAEAWIELDKIRRLSPNALAHIQQGRPLEVSVGVFNDTEYTEGEWNGEHYEAIASNYRPDHLALLPGEKGACSWEDGCGIRANSEGGAMPENLIAIFKDLNQKGFSVSPISNEEGFSEVTRALQEALNAMDTGDRLYMLAEVYADYFIYAVQDRELGKTTLYKRAYSMVDSGVQISDNAVEVRKKVEYVTMTRNKMVRTKPSINSNNGGQKMSDENLCCEAKVDALIANKQTAWTDADREWLLTQEESVIDKMTPKVVSPAAPQVNEEEVISTFKQTLKSLDDFTALMPEEMKAEVEKGVEAYRSKREALVQSILGNSDKFDQETLEALTDSTLEGIAATVNDKPADYSGMGGGGGNPEEVTPLLPPGVTAE